MFEKLFVKLKDFEDHHQVLFALIVTFGIICFSWGVENILEKFIFPNKPVFGYITAILVGLFLLWLTKHIILHVM